MKKKQQKSQIIILTALSIFVVGLILSIAGMSQTVVDLEKETISHTPAAILASAGVENGNDISLPVAYYDQKQDPCVNLYDTSTRQELDARQFEWTQCGYISQQLEPGLVDYYLGEDYLPVAHGGELLPNRGLTDMSRWFNNVEGKSKQYAGNLQLVYHNDEQPEFAYADNDFYPLDTADFSNGDSVNSDGHNHLFTMSFAVPFNVRADGTESLEITADDDTFVYVGSELALDMGGIHSATTGKLAINELGEVYTTVETPDLAYSGIQVSKDGGSVIRIIHADRDSSESVFRIKLSGMELNIVQSQLADSDGVQVAYDPSDPGYIGPLGESTTVRPDSTKGYMIIATVLGVVIVACAVFTVILTRTLLRRR